MSKHRPKTSSREAADDRVFRALARMDRRRILDMLRDSPRTTGDLVRRMPWLSRCTVMQHLGVLEEAGLVVTVKKGRSRWNHLDVGPVQRIHERWIGEYAMPAARMLSRLRQELETIGAERKRSAG